MPGRALACALVGMMRRFLCAAGEHDWQREPPRWHHGHAALDGGQEPPEDGSSEADYTILYETRCRGCRKKWPFGTPREHLYVGGRLGR